MSHPTGPRAILLAPVVIACIVLSSATTLSSAPSKLAAPPPADNRLGIGFDIPPFVPTPFVKISNAFGIRPPLRGDIATQLVYDALYRYDGSLEPVPDLAAEPCSVAPDKVTITCKIVETTFHDGSPLTADDVAFTYELGRRGELGRPASDPSKCMFAFGLCFAEMLESVSALDADTVEFKLSAPNATFLTLILPSVLIDSRAVIEAAYEPLRQRASDLDAATFQDLSDQIAATLRGDAPDCEGLLPEAERLLESTDLPLLPREQFDVADGTFDACLYLQETGIRLSDVALSLRASGLDRIALAYRALAFNQHPIGTGPWRFKSVEDGHRAVFEAFDGYHFGRPATGTVEVTFFRQPGGLLDGLVSGEIDWAPLPADLYDQVKDVAGLRFASYPDAAYYTLAYNLRPGMLFADHALRAAVELCIDKPATVDAATRGTGDVIYSPIDPILWAYEPNLEHPQRDVTEARRLIETAGWTTGPDGIYVRDGERLASDVYTRADDDQRIRFMDLAAEQVRDCGIELNTVRVDGNALVSALYEYPPIPPGSDEPFEAVFIAFAHGFDPDDTTWSSRQVTSEQNPAGYNFMGFADADIDRLLDEGIASYDQRERARIYREFQRVLADEQPVLFAWGTRLHDALDSRLHLTDGSVDLTTRQWWWQLEKLVVGD